MSILARRTSLVALLVLSSCVGEVGNAPGVPATGGTGGSTTPRPGAPPDPGTSPPPPPGVPPDAPPPPPPAAGASSGGRPVVRMLSRDELRNALEDLTGHLATDADLPYGDIAVTSLSSPPSDFMGATDFDKLDRLTVAAATAFVAKLQASAQKCADGNAACVDAFLTANGRRIFRRPLDATETDAYRRVYAAEKTRKGHDAGLALSMVGMLQSPHFLYRLELGQAAGGGYHRLTDWEYASALSFLLTRSVPDDVLLTAAAGGKLRTADGVRAEVKRLLVTRRGQQGVLDFYTRWLHLQEYAGTEKDDKLFPSFDTAYKTAALRELTETVKREVLSGTGNFKNLLTTRRGFVDAKLAATYKVTAPAQPAATDLDQATRAGVFTQVAFLSGASKENDTNPLHAGKVVFEQVLCLPFPPPPDNPFLVPFTPDPNATRRQNMETRTSGGNCVGCHRLLNPLAFAFDAYDPIGRHRTTLDGRPLDVSGALVGSDVDGPFTGVPQLMSMLAGSKRVSECHVTQWLRYALGRHDDAADAPSLARAHDAFVKSGYDVVAMLTELVLSDSFVLRRSP